jgi:hypothetical protein
MEASQPPDVVIKYYDELLTADSANGVRLCQIPLELYPLTCVQ